MIFDKHANLLKEDMAGDQTSLKEYMDPFMVARESRQKETAA